MKICLKGACIMELSQLRYFIKSAELQHLTKAAAELNISQPALTKVIRQLEEELDAELFERRGRNIFLTECGQILLQRANELVCFADDICTEINELKIKQQEVTVISRALGNLMPEIVKEFIAAYPNIKLTLIQDDNLTMQNFSYDLIISMSFVNTNTSNSVILLQEPFKIGLSRLHPLAQKEEVSLFDLQDTPFLGLTNSRLINKLIRQQFDDLGFSPKTIFYCDNIHTIMHLIAANTGFSVMPQYAWLDNDKKGINLLQISDFSFCRNISISWKAKSYISEPARLFKNFVVQWFRKMDRHDTMRADGEKLE